MSQEQAATDERRQKKSKKRKHEVVDKSQDKASKKSPRRHEKAREPEVAVISDAAATISATTEHRHPKQSDGFATDEPRSIVPDSQVVPSTQLPPSTRPGVADLDDLAASDPQAADKSAQTDTVVLNNAEKIQKVAKAIGKYLKKNDIERENFKTSLRAHPVHEDAFYSFAKRYFASLSQADFEVLTEKALFGAPLKRKNHPVQAASKTNDESAASPEPLQKKRKRTTKGKEIVIPPGGYVPGPFTAEERAKMADEVKSYCDEQGISENEFCTALWDEKTFQGRDRVDFYLRFSDLLPARKPKSVRDYIRRAYMPFERGPFTAEEDKEIVRLHAELGSDWKSIGKKLGRYSNDLRDRYRNSLQMAEVDVGPWTDAETAKFYDILNTFKSKKEYNWELIAQKMGTRSRPACRDKYLRTLDKKGGPPKAITGHKSGGRETVPKGTRILEGDKYHMLKLLQKNSIASMQEVLDKKNVLAAYEGLFAANTIMRRLQPLIDAAEGDSFEAKVAGAIKNFEDRGTADLQTTLVDDEDDV